MDEVIRAARVDIVVEDKISIFSMITAANA